MALNRKDIDFNKRVRDLVSRDNNKLRLEFDKFEKEYNNRLAEIHSMQEKMKHSMRELALEKKHIQEKQQITSGESNSKRHFGLSRRHMSAGASELLTPEKRRLYQSTNNNEVQESAFLVDTESKDSPHAKLQSDKAPFSVSGRKGVSAPRQRRVSLPFHHSSGSISPGASSNFLLPVGSPRGLFPIGKVSESICVRLGCPSRRNSPSGSPVEHLPHFQENRHSNSQPSSTKEFRTPFMKPVKAQQNLNIAASHFPQSHNRTLPSVETHCVSLRPIHHSSSAVDHELHNFKDSSTFSCCKKLQMKMRRNISEPKPQSLEEYTKTTKLRSSSLSTTPPKLQSDLPKFSSDASGKRHAVLSRKRSCSLPGDV